MEAIINSPNFVFIYAAIVLPVLISVGIWIKAAEAYRKRR